MKNARRAVSALALLSAFAGHVHAEVQRWNIDVVGLENVHVSSSYGSPVPIVTTRTRDIHGYFTGEDLNGDSAIDLGELKEFSPFTRPDVPQDPWAMQWASAKPPLTFSYSPTSGLSFTQSFPVSLGSINEVFGQRFSLGTPYYSEAVTWTGTTQTTITAVPEPGSTGLLALGLLAVGGTLRRHRR